MSGSPDQDPPTPGGGPPRPRAVSVPRPPATKLPPLKRTRAGMLRGKPIKERNPIGVAVIGLAVILVLGMLAYRADDLPVIGGGTTYTADFSEAAGLKPDDEVRVAGVKVGKVTGVELDGAKVKVTFRVKDTWIGNASTAGIMIKTLLGAKYLAVDPLGPSAQDPGRRIPMSRTVSPYDVTQAFQDLSGTIDRLDTVKVAQSLETIADTFSNTPPSVRKALDGLSALSQTISTRDAQLARLLTNAKQVTGVLAEQSGEFERLLRDGNLLLAELRRRREAIHGLLVGSQALARQLSGLVADNRAQLAPTLQALDRITDVLQRNQDNLNRALAVAGPYNRLLGNALGNGRWMDGYLCGVVPKEYLAPNTPPKTGCMPPKQNGASPTGTGGGR
ncbi:MCE family protein [Actinomadura viridis]|uniref:Phospholipid/cholesterol/gamma-HCH transport system substrate-binding protein n=1 Tax=Actinomadura viridis TaxID=58110 RepID=A0A931DNV4_9ACTN|nr:MCE family protein [Actinomadura viridis]MBG6091362.1 phospholipid/cholesterol/gamma-HCH transport system substrate-binding protein [Actinomadura viridis]